MKKRNIRYLLVILLFTSVLTFYLITANTTFQNEVTDHLNIDEISQFNVIKVNGEEADTIYVSEQNQINSVLTDLSNLDLRKVFSIKRDNSEWYVLMIGVNGKIRYTINIYGKKYISITDHASTNSTGSNKYKISSDFDVKTLQDLFK
ncbi:hypothetical protein [Paenibacillus sp. NPDC057967]|uniref:hypothetical protein n=1 Tax=Paenibacillus sp. NPDC057967 TaxID=3346293 RepID=UPI0036DD326B